MEDINRDDALFNMINKHSTDMEEQRKEENRRQEIIQHNFMLSQRAIATSTRREEVAREAAIRRQEITKERRKKVALILVGMATAVVLMVPAMKNVSNNIKDYKDTSTAISIMQNDAIEDLSKNGLINVDGKEFNITEPNTSISYQRLDVSSPEEVYVYKTILSNVEFNKLIGSLSYHTDTGEIRYYSSFEEYLRFNNFSSEKDFTDEMRDNILKSYRADLEKSGGIAR